MIHTFKYIIMCALAVVATACHSDYDDYTTSGEIALSLPVEGEIEIIQYSVQMMNLNSRSSVTFADKTSGIIPVVNILRGAYSINIEGVVRFRGASHVLQTHQFRALSEFVPFVSSGGNRVELEMILMD